MSTTLDIRVSQRMRRIIDRLDQLVTKEVGEQMGIGLVLFPFAPTGQDHPGIAEYQYASNCPREHMHGALKALVAKWDSGHPDIPPHEKQ